MCAYCDITLDPFDRETRFEHLMHAHNFCKCSLEKKFFRIEDFRQHLKYSHAAITNGSDPHMLEEACMKNKPLPERLDVIPSVLEHATADLADILVERPGLLETPFEDGTDATSPGVTISNALVPRPIDSPQRQSFQGQRRHEFSESTCNSAPSDLCLSQHPQAAVVQTHPRNDGQASAAQLSKSELPAEATKPQNSFACQICQQSFTRRTSLVNHQRTHTGEKPYSCTVSGCDRTFAQQGDKTRHEQAQHSEKTFICGGTSDEGVSWGCGKAFGRKDGLLEHHRKTAKGKRCFEERQEQRSRRYWL
jgi:hypothetical protein